MHVQSALEDLAPGAGDSAMLTASGGSAVAVAGNPAGGPYRRIIKPAKALVTRSRILRETAQAAIEKGAKSGSSGGGTCLGCICCPGKGAGHSTDGSTASLAFESDTKHSLGGPSISQSDVATVKSPVAAAEP